MIELAFKAVHCSVGFLDIDADAEEADEDHTEEHTYEEGNDGWGAVTGGKAEGANHDDE